MVINILKHILNRSKSVKDPFPLAGGLEPKIQIIFMLLK